MMWFVRAIGLVFEGVLLQFIQGTGFLGLAAAAVAGYIRAPVWSILLMAAAFGIGVDWLPLEGIGLLDKATTASQRGGFLVIVFFVIVTAGYAAGRYGRHHVEKRKQPA